MFEERKIPYLDISEKLVKLSGYLFILLAIIFNEFLLTKLDSHPPLNHVTVMTVRSVQVTFAIIGIILILCVWLMKKVTWIKSVFAKPMSVKILLFVLVLGVPLTVIEFGLRPVALMGKTYIFMDDEELVWKLRPNAVDNWGGTTVRINGKGYRGPEYEYAKPDGVRRILHLGDSVSFGYLLKDYNQAYPPLLEKILEEKTGDNIQTVNLSVGGYATWQENIQLRREGYKYNSDLVILSFVLNDVTNMFSLKRFGGHSEIGHLELGFSSRDAKWFNKSGILYLVRRVSAKFRFGKEVQKAASQMEARKVFSLIETPDHPDVQRAWNGVFKDLQDIVDYCDSNDIDFLLVIFPFTLQFKDEERMSIPQQTLIRYAEEHNIKYLDILNFFSILMKKEGTIPNNYFLDYDHLNPLGNDLVAEEIARFISDNKMLDD